MDASDANMRLGSLQSHGNSSPQVEYSTRTAREVKDEPEVLDPDELYANAGPHTSNPPLSRVSLTAYRLLNMAVITAFGTAKAVFTIQGECAAPTVLDWFLGVVLAVTLYWIGLWESVRPRVLPWFFHRDYTREILSFFGRLIGSFFVVLMRGFVVPLASFAITFVPAWFIFEPVSGTGQGQPILLVLVTTLGFLALCVGPHLICTTYCGGSPIHVLASLIMRYMPRHYSDVTLKNVRKIQKLFPSNVCSSGSALSTMADLSVIVGIIGAATIALHQLFLRSETFQSVESASAMSLLIVAVMRDEEDLEDYAYSWAVFPVLLLHGCYSLATGHK